MIAIAGLAASVLLPAMACAKEAPLKQLAPGDRPAEEMKPAIQSAISLIQSAMDAKDEAAVYKAVEALREALGPYAGVPESPVVIVAPADTSKPPLTKLKTTWQAVYTREFSEIGSFSEVAGRNQMELREAAYTAIACAAAADAGLDSKEMYIDRIRKELDYLLERQGENGMFPYPAKPRAASPPNVHALVKRLSAGHPELVRNGYLYVQRPGTQFDTGCGAFALAEGYRLTGDKTYLEGARRAGDWALEFPLDANWNYNAFSVWQLAKLYSVTGERIYLESALEKATLGVLPGLMDNGLWVDQHNAKQSYHFIMARALVQLLEVLPETHPRYNDIRNKTIRAIDARAEEILRDGVSNRESALMGLSLALEWRGGNATWENAAHAVANAVLKSPRPNPVALPLYLRYRMRAANQ